MTTRVLGTLGLLVLGLAAPPPGAGAEAGADAPRLRLTIVQPDLLPFSQMDLETAARLRVRLAANDDANVVTAAIGPAPEDGHVDVRLPDRQRIVDVAGQTPSDAARTVALVLLDMAAESNFAAPAPEQATVRAAARAPQAPEPSRWSWALTPGLSLASDAGVSFAPAVQVDYDVLRVRLVLSVGYFRNAVRAREGLTDRGLTLDALPLRLGMAYPLHERLAVQAGTIIRPYHVGGELAARAAQSGWSTQAGGWVGATTRLASWGGFAASAFAYADVFANEVTHGYGDVHILRVFPWSLHVGVAIGYRRGRQAGQG